MTKIKKVEEAQEHLRKMHVDGWLLYDFHKNNELAHLFLEIPKDQMVTRRFFYWIPAKGEPIKIVHAIEPHILDAWPGQKKIFLSWESLHAAIGEVLKGMKRIAMEYSPKNAIPYVSKVDAGTVDLVRSFGVEVVSSGTFLPHFTAVITKEQGESHIRAGKKLDEIVMNAWKWIQESKAVTEYDLQQKILADFKKEKLVTDGSPIVAVNAHSADPHFSPCKEKSTRIQRGDFILIDLWCKEEGPGAIFGDITRVGVFAKEPTKKQQEVFSIVRAAQKAGTELVKKRFAAQKTVCGWEVDDCVRNVIQKAGYGKYFTHRTGHSIEVNLHGSGTHIDNLEMHDERPILPSTCFSIEPGIYLPGEFGIRLEYDVYIHQNGKVEIVGGEQDEIVALS
jgi:Xaa-Pro aminopeptidase